MSIRRPAAPGKSAPEIGRATRLWKNFRKPLAAPRDVSYIPLMSSAAPLLATHIAGIAAGICATAEPRGEPLPAWRVLILALLMRLFPRLRPAAPILAAFDLPTPENRPTYCYDVHGRAPHAAVVALGLVPDWILVGAPGRGMRPTRHPRLPHRPTQPARAPPGCFSAPQPPSPPHGYFITLSYQIPRLAPTSLIP